MYFPYLRTQRFELLAIHERADLIVESGHIIPVLEPTRENTDELLRNLHRYREAGIPIIVIENPGVGELRDNPEFVDTHIISRIEDNYDQLRVAHLIGPESTTDELAEALIKNRGRAFSFVHRHNFRNIDNLRELEQAVDSFEWHIFIDGSTGEAYRSRFSDANRVLIDDGFVRRERNADYPEESFFSDLYSRYASMGYEGFGDFLIVGDQYSPRGGPAHAVALHMITQSPEGLITRHFVSDRTEGTRDTAGKYLEAVEKLVIASQYDDVLASSSAFTEFEENLQTSHFPTLGYAKKLSMMHHLEVISRIIG